MVISGGAFAPHPVAPAAHPLAPTAGETGSVGRRAAAGVKSLVKTNPLLYDPPR